MNFYSNSRALVLTPRRHLPELALVPLYIRTLLNSAVPIAPLDTRSARMDLQFELFSHHPRIEIPSCQHSGDLASVGRTSTLAGASQCGVHSRVEVKLGDSTGLSHALRTQRRQAPSQQWLERAWWFLVVCGVRCIDCLIPPLPRRLRPSRSNQRLVLVLGIPGANPFSDVLLPL